jgi:ATP-dependent DNA helicase RecG
VGGAWRDPLPDVLVMTATPIPRTLAMTVYGDLDVSYLDELPPGRQPVCTRVLPERERERAYTAVRAELERGRQAFVVLPLVEDSTELAVRSAVGTAEELRGGVFEGYRVGLVHGRMPPAEKDAVMHDFRQKAYDVLVCTTVIEVGIDVPNAAVIVVEHADRFGLAQLHQLRGRVGRGQEAASCHLIASADCSALGFERLRVLRETNDGFEIGEADLRIRGPGEFLGTRQAGLPEFRVARLLRDTALLEAAREEARRHLEAGAGPRTMARHIVDLVGRHRWADRLGLAEVG